MADRNETQNCVQERKTYRLSEPLQLTVPFLRDEFPFVSLTSPSQVEYSLDQM